jgi:hypothetical protein
MRMHRLIGRMVAAAAAVALAVPAAAHAGWQRGVGYTNYDGITYGTAASDSSLARVALDGNSSVELVVTRYMWNATASSVYATPRTPTDASLLHAMQTARSLGLAVVLKPQVNVLSGEWRGTIAPSSPSAWFDSLEATTYHYADLAQQGGASMLVVGTELKTMSGPAYTDRWRQLIAGVRARFSGRLTYAANYDEFRQVQFWPLLDYIGVDAYWGLAHAPDPSLDSLVSAWASAGHVDALRQASLTAGKPVLFTEIGYRSVAGAAIHPNWWDTTGDLDLNEQSNAFEAVYRVFSGQPWFAGLYWWGWPATLPPDGSNTDYVPAFKPAEQVMQSWNAKLAAAAEPVAPAPVPPAPVAPAPLAPAPPTVAALAPARTSQPKRPLTKPHRSCRPSRHRHRVRSGASRAVRRCKTARAHRRTAHAAPRSRAGR